MAAEGEGGGDATGNVGANDASHGEENTDPKSQSSCGGEEEIAGKQEKPDRAESESLVVIAEVTDSRTTPIGEGGSGRGGEGGRDGSGLARVAFSLSSAISNWAVCASKSVPVPRMPGVWDMSLSSPQSTSPSGSVGVGALLLEGVSPGEPSYIGEQMHTSPVNAPQKP